MRVSIINLGLMAIALSVVPVLGLNDGEVAISSSFVASNGSAEEGIFHSHFGTGSTQSQRFPDVTFVSASEIPRPTTVLPSTLPASGTESEDEIVTYSTVSGVLLDPTSTHVTLPFSTGPIETPDFDSMFYSATHTAGGPPQPTTLFSNGTQLSSGFPTHVIVPTIRENSTNTTGTFEVPTAVPNSAGANSPFYLSFTLIVAVGMLGVGL